MSRTQASLVVALQLGAVYLLHLGSLEVAYIHEMIQNRLSIPASALPAHDLLSLMGNHTMSVINCVPACGKEANPTSHRVPSA